MFMKNIVIAIVLSISFIICASISAKDRYKIVMNSVENAPSIVIKYDTVTGRTWRLVFPENQWTEAIDSGKYFVPLDENKEKDKNK